MTGRNSNVPEMIGGYRAFPMPGGNDWRKYQHYRNDWRKYQHFRNDWRRITRHPTKFVTKTYTDPPLIEKRMKNRQSFRGRGPEKRTRIRCSFSNGRKPANHLLQEPQNTLRTASRLPFSRLGTCQEPLYQMDDNRTRHPQDDQRKRYFER